MQVATIPKNLLQKIKDDFVIIPRREYDNLLLVFKKAGHYKQLDEDLNKAIKEVKQGKAIGPFSTAKDLMSSLKAKA